MSEKPWTFSEEALELGYCGKYWKSRFTKVLTKMESRHTLSLIAFKGPEEAKKYLKSLSYTKNSYESLVKDWELFVEDGIGFERDKQE